MKEPAISLSGFIETALTKFSDASFECGAFQGDPNEYIKLTNTRDRAQQDLIALVRKYTADAIAHATGLDHTSNRAGADGVKRMKTMEEMKRAHVQYALSITDTMDQAARLLKIDIATLFRMRKRWGMPMHEQYSGTWKDGKPEATSSDD